MGWIMRHARQCAHFCGSEVEGTPFCACLLREEKVEILTSELFVVCGEANRGEPVDHLCSIPLRQIFHCRRMLLFLPGHLKINRRNPVKASSKRIFCDWILAQFGLSNRDPSESLEWGI